jgi:hypothetical protein
MFRLEARFGSIEHERRGISVHKVPCQATTRADIGDEEI